MAQPSNYELFTGDYFHNGHDVLPEVTAWHDFLRYSLRRSDPLTGKILDIVDHFMLKGDTRDRHNAAEVNRDYKQCLDQCLAEASHAEFEPPGDLWSNHRNIIALAEQEASDDELVVSQHFSALSRTQRSPRSPPSSPQQHPQSRTWPMAHQEKLALEPSRQPQERSSASTDEGVRETAPDKPRQQSVVRFKSAQEDAIGQRYNMTWARKSLRLDEPRFRSPTRSLLRSAAKKVGVKQKSGLDSNVLTSSLASFYKDRSLVFLVDSGTSMREHWSEATTLLETLLTLAKGVGNLRAIDLRFTSQRNISVNQERNVRQFMRAMMAARPKSDVQAVNTKEKMQVLGSLKTDMAATLSALFAEYKEKIRRSRGFTIIVLTDGMWAPGDPGAVQQEISKFADQFGRPYPRHRPFNIEFVWFGHAGEQAKKLTELDGQTKDSR
ncbi:hypothetical protein B0T16DRAFT_194504 [Cercophora newfieldiana]|uniref:VWFA domain-containing protein n=1 Tax=Cercophora newfieldiana TaxID=92897 RepID=A0AA39Y1J8_9PEZI|nr:hypothetical protein B0T16DRAFT_194504 [Cercophora newfieldiana]